MDNLPEDVIICIFLKIDWKKDYLMINKIINKILLSESYWYKYFNKPSIDYYELSLYKKNEQLYYKVYILEFILNKNRKQTILFCKNSYQRMLAYKFIQQKELKYEKVQVGFKKCLYCENCNSFEIYRYRDYDDDYYWYKCRNCNRSLSKYMVELKYRQHYGIKIFK